MILMNEILLNAILNLFAIQTSLIDSSGRSDALSLISRYLRDYLRITHTDEYIKLFEEALDIHQLRDEQTKLAQAREITANLKRLLPRFDQYVFLLRYLELENMGGCRREDLGDIVAAELQIAPAVRSDLSYLTAAHRGDSLLTADFLCINHPEKETQEGCRKLSRPDFCAAFTVYHLQDADAYFLRVDQGKMTADSLSLTSGTAHLLLPGSILRDLHGNCIYYQEIAAAFQTAPREPLLLRAENLEFRYPGSDTGLHDFSFCEAGGRLVGIMGQSGSGKSTLLNILTGQLPPDRGRVSVNGLDLYRDAARLEGVIGYVPQDDLLFEHLSVFDNLAFNAALCLANLDKKTRDARVEALLAELQQLPTRDLMVGSPLEKTISGGERKRLNIALELLREPSILLVDEPTSGLSSADSENVMALLKAQAAKGKLVIVVIHQPSSRIYRMFDALWILDQGGRPIFSGNPLDAIVYFRTEARQADMDEYACPGCGSVNPEQLFEIIQARAVDENGRFTPRRRVPPEEWHRRYLAARDQQALPQASCDTVTAQKMERRLWRPGRAGQFWIFFLRTLKGHVQNRQYLFINLLEPPLLAVIAALICRGSWGLEYVFQENRNLSSYFFISVVVAIFLGLSISAEEINRDRKALKRERLLHLSWTAYIGAKTFYLAGLAALQLALFVWLGNAILHIPDMNGVSWAVLFFCALVSCILGLNVSAGVRSAVNIYIIIPILLIPQIMLGGASVSFDELMDREAGTRSVPAIANVMPSRWGYEALVVEQYAKNRYMRLFFQDERLAVNSDYMLQAYLPELKSLADYPLLEAGEPDHAARTKRTLAVLATELKILEEKTKMKSGLPYGLLAPQSYTPDVCRRVKEYLERAENEYRRLNAQAAAGKRIAEKRLNDALGIDGAQQFKSTYYNEDIAGLVLNVKNLEAVRLSGGRLVRVAAPVFEEPQSKLGGAPFLASSKQVGSRRVETLVFNLLVLAGMAVLLFLALDARLLPRLLNRKRTLP
jgi:ABC transport system ATP-binding/permease protein